ncbi:MAG: hypothetical protein JST75_14740 [Bacteroidetes bacterium]|nr:hypothetical protein [Bacteroidota bacterium]
MIKFFLFGIGLIIVFKSYSQTERVYLHLDKYNCRTGDTIWFKGYVFKGDRPTQTSTNLYAELFTSEGKLLSRNIFPIINGISVGQIIVPDSIVTDNYYLRAFTRYQLNYDSLNLFSVPILVYNKEQPRLITHKKRVVYPNSLVFCSINGIDWTTSVNEGKLASVVSIDSPTIVRNLHILKPSVGDSAFVADILLDKTVSQKYISLPLDSTKESEILLLYEGYNLIGSQVIHLRNNSFPVKLIADTLDTKSFGYNSWRIELPDTTIYTISVSVSDLDRSSPQPVSITKLNDSYSDNLSTVITEIDTSFITFSGTAIRESGKKINDPFSNNLLVAGVKDTNFTFLKVIHLDNSGHFKMDSLVFFDSLDLQFQINKYDDGSTKNVKLNLTKFIPPGSDSFYFYRNWEDDTIKISKVDTFFTKPELNAHELSKMKVLKPVVVKGWKSHRNELDNRYTTSAFSEPALYSFDVRTERRFHDLGEFLRMQFPRFQGGYAPSDTPTDAMGHYFLFFVDEQNYAWRELNVFDWNDIAYIKCFENDFIGDDDFIRWKNTQVNIGPPEFGKKELTSSFPKTPVIIAIYTRKGTDYRTKPGGLNKISVKGYSRILQFKPDRISLYWDPLHIGNNFRIRFNNNETARRFRVIIEGVNSKGEIVHAEKNIQ